MPRSANINSSAFSLINFITMATMREATYSPQNGHDYRTWDKVCGRALTNSEMKDLMSRFAVPTAFAGMSNPNNGLACFPSMSINTELLWGSDKGLILYFSVAIFIVLIHVSNRFLSHWWVLAVLGFYIEFHIVAVTVISFSRLGFPAVVLVPLGLADFAFWFSALWVSESRLGVS